MINLPGMRACREQETRDYRDGTEILSGLASSTELGLLIEHNIKTIIKNKKAIAEQLESPNRNEKLIAKANENIQSCTNTIKLRLTRLDASNDVIKSVIDDIDNDNIEQALLKVLELMARKNPQVNGRIYKQALAASARSGR